LAGKPAPESILANIPRLVTDYYAFAPDPAAITQRVAFGTSGHRGTSLECSFNEEHILAITQAICIHRRQQGIDGPLFIGIDTHALSEPAFASGALFTANDGVIGQGLWFTDGTSGETREVMSFPSDPYRAFPQFFTSLPGQVLFVAGDSSAGRELWRTDGTTSGTGRVADINPGTASGSAIESSLGAVVLNGVAYFGADDGVHGIQLWRSDGTAPGTFL